MKRYKNTPPPAHINVNATETLSLRLVPEIRNALEDESNKCETSLTCVALSAFRLFFESRRPKDQSGNSLYW